MPPLRAGLCVALLFAASAPGHAAQVVHSQSYRSAALREKNLKADVARWKPLLEEYRAGKRDDSDGYAILWHILHDYGLLHYPETPESAKLVKEYQALLKKHPDYINRRFMRTHEQRAARETAIAKAREIERERKSWVPQDAYVMEVQQQGARAMVGYQYRLEFYQVPDGTRLETTGGKLALRSKARVVPLSRAELVKSENFVHPFNIAYVSGGSASAPIRDFWICSDPAGGYTAHTEKEQRILGYHSQGGYIPYWKNPNGKVESFCGVLDINGKIVYKFPARYQPRMNGPWIRPLIGSPNGKRLLLQVGRPVEDTADGGLEFGDVRQFLILDAPDNLRIIKVIPDAPGHEGQFQNKILKQYGFMNTSVRD